MDLVLYNLQRLLYHKIQPTNQQTNPAQSSRAIEYADCLSAEGYDLPTNTYPGYESKLLSDDKGTVLELLEIWSTPSLL